jgi:hypothetical protein
MQAFPHYRIIHYGDYDMIIVPGDLDNEIKNGIEAYIERIAICTIDGGLSEEEAKRLALHHILKASQFLKN